MPDAPTWTAIVLCGGRSSRLGYDKSRATIDGRALIDLVVHAIPRGVPCVVVGPDPGPLSRSVLVTREDPPGSGPVAGIAAGLSVVTTDLVAVIAVDMPFAGLGLVDLVDGLLEMDASLDAMLPLDADGRPQPLAAVYRTQALRKAVVALDTPIGASVRSLIAHLRIREVPVASPAALMDVDTSDDLAAARRTVLTDGRGDDPMEDQMDDWVAAVSAALGIEQDVDVELILDVARDAAHGVARPAAPVTTFLLGCAVAGGMSAKDAAERVTTLAKEWPATQ